MNYHPLDIDRIHLRLGGDPSFPFYKTDRAITAEYYSGARKVDEQAAPETLALALGSIWWEEMGGIFEFGNIKLTAAWPVDFGRTRKLESQMRKALEQAPC